MHNYVITKLSLNQQNVVRYLKKTVTVAYLKKKSD